MSVAPGAQDNKATQAMSGMGLSYDLPARAAVRACDDVACSRNTWVDSSDPCQRSGVMVAGEDKQRTHPVFEYAGPKLSSLLR